MTPLEAIDREGGTNVIAALADISPELGPCHCRGVWPLVRQRRPRSTRSPTRNPRNAHCAWRLRTPIGRTHQRRTDVRLDPALIIEALLHSAVYCGMPKALNANLIVKKVFFGTKPAPTDDAESLGTADHNSRSLAQVSSKRTFRRVEQMRLDRHPKCPATSVPSAR